jgi:hypothetical protein
LSEKYALAAASLLLAIALVAAFVGFGDSGQEKATSVLASPTASASVVVKTPGPVVTSKPAASEKAGTATPAPAASAAPLAPGQPGPPKAGTYHYKSTRNGESEDSEVRIVDRGGGRQTESIDDELFNETEWRKDGKFVTQSAFGQSANSFRCKWEPPFQELAFPFSAGKTWKVDSSCEARQGLTFRITGTARVTGKEQVKVAGTTLETWVIKTQGTLQFKSGAMSSDQKIDSDERFSVPHGLSVRSVEKTSGTDPQTGQTRTTTTTREIKNLTPEQSA